MNPDAARLVFGSIMASGIVVWVWSLIRALRLGLAPSHAARLTDAGTWEADGETGELTIRGEPARLSKDLVRSLQQANVSMFGVLFEVKERTSKRLVLKKTGPIICNQPPGLYFSEAEFDFRSVGNDTVCVSFRLGYERLVCLLKRIALCIILGAGLPTILIGGAFLWIFVVQSEDPTVRWQVFQTFQIAHALWPPFLFMWFHGLGRRQSKVFVENLIASVEVLE